MSAATVGSGMGSAAAGEFVRPDPSGGGRSRHRRECGCGTGGRQRDGLVTGTDGVVAARVAPPSTLSPTWWVHDFPMKAGVLHAPGQISADEVAAPGTVTPSDALVRVVAAGICGSDLWGYRGVTAEQERRIGHEFVGVIEELGSEVEGLSAGQLVIAPFLWSCGKCPHCVAGWTTPCLTGGGYGANDRDGHLVDGGQGQYVRLPQTTETLVPVPADEHDERMAAVLSSSDVMGTGHHAALSAGVGPRSTVAVIGDGAVGPCAVLAGTLDPSRVFTSSVELSEIAIGDDDLDRRRSLKVLVRP